jgi:hypothetical protein
MNRVKSFSVFENDNTIPTLNKDQKWFLSKCTGVHGYWSNPETKKIDLGKFDIYNIAGGSVRNESTQIYESLTEIGFGVCKSGFRISDLLIEDLKGSPEIVEGNFECTECSIKSIVGSPRRVDGKFFVSSNPIYNLIGSPDYVGGIYHFGSFNSPGFTLEGLTPLDKIGVEMDEESPVLIGSIRNGENIKIKKKDLELPKILNLYRLSDHIPTQEMLYPLVTPEKIQEYIDENPERFVTGFLPKIWDQVIQMKGYENLKVPEKYRDEFDDFSDLTKLGF